ncbi:hypothetical protein [Pelotomaculum propionicicum]|uniref:Histidine kinase/HSP90-like ATPase domain-containing protein n=1 Tax=Pelotomaculum propionicicum TaxID=258475 RepID=A0A4Y7RMM6_9FIRM|nr:hypothetical protein [Pelotomaculum propionicicum]NLI13807.1 hypothetical protein [Peptococcaceae bacterium]TEB10248.1 hypothetical protein Pmgp_02548 [Pelotomaculum propionicicum]
MAFDMSNITFIKPGGAILLLLMCKQVWGKTLCKVRLDNLRFNVQSYLNRIDFFKNDFVYTNDRLSLWSKFGRNDRSLSVIEITRILNPMDVAKFRETAKTITNKWFPGDNLKPEREKFSTMIMEICNNSLEHSTGSEEMGECYGLLQVYSHSEKPEISVSIGDLGIGIRTHLKKKYSWVYNSDSATIKKVLEGLSGRLDGTGGMGIPFIKNTTVELKGTLIIRSGRGIVSVGNMAKTSEFVGSFPGTQYQIILNKK